MTLVCECGGMVEITAQSYTDAGAFEAYKCVACGRTGSLRHDETTGTTLSGSVVSQ